MRGPFVRLTFCDISAVSKTDIHAVFLRIVHWAYDGCICKPRSTHKKNPQS